MSTDRAEARVHRGIDGFVTVYHLTMAGSMRPFEVYAYDNGTAEAVERARDGSGTVVARYPVDESVVAEAAAVVRLYHQAALRLAALTVPLVQARHNAAQVTTAA